MLLPAMLLVKGGPSNGAIIPLPPGQSIMGRAPQCAVMWDDASVSRQHASIRTDSHGYTITDLGSMNGTFVNGKSIEKESRRLRHMDRIQLGGAGSVVTWVFMESQATVSLPSIQGA